MLQVADKAMLFHFAVYLLRFKRTSNLIRAFLRPVPPPPPTLIASGKAGKMCGGSESKQSNAAAGELTTVPGRNTVIPQVNSPSGLDCSVEAARRVLSGRRCIYLASANGQRRMVEWTTGLTDAWTFCICHSASKQDTQHKQEEEECGLCWIPHRRRRRRRGRSCCALCLNTSLHFATATAATWTCSCLPHPQPLVFAAPVFALKSCRDSCPCVRGSGKRHMGIRLDALTTFTKS